MAAPGNCDDRTRVTAVMGTFVYPPWVPIPPMAFPLGHPPCGANQPLCQVKRRNNERHPVPPFGPMIPGVPTTPNRSVCDFCHTQGLAMAGSDRWFPPPAGGPMRYLRGTEAVFRDNGANHLAALAAGVQRVDLQLGAHHLGKLCFLCENTEIQRYWQRRFGGVRRQPEARAANTCKCEAHLSKSLCYQDRVNYLLDVEQKSLHNAAGPGCWLKWLFIHPVTGRATRATPGNVAQRNLVTASRGPGTLFEENACRCGRDIATADVVNGANNTPTPVAMCTACDGVLIDVNHHRVTGWANGNLPPVLPLHEQGNLKLRRNVDEV